MADLMKRWNDGGKKAQKSQLMEKEKKNNYVALFVTSTCQKPRLLLFGRTSKVHLRPTEGVSN